MSENRGGFQVDLLFDALSDHHRRHLTAYMHTSDIDIFHLDGLVQIIARLENESAEVSDKQRERVKTSLHHRHLPKMDDARLIEYDYRNGDVRYRGIADVEIIDVSKLLNTTEEIADTAGR